MGWSLQAVQIIKRAQQSRTARNTTLGTNSNSIQPQVLLTKITDARHFVQNNLTRYQVLHINLVWSF